jgi:D-sedoheptulose 7-phosphate isomerase
MINNIKSHFQQSAQTMLAASEVMSTQIIKAIDIISQAMEQGHKLMICGNGGSAADAQHMAAEFVVRLNPKIKRRGLPAIALTTDTSIITAAGNDFSFQEIFARQVEALALPGDILLAISTSGHSSNILKAVETAKKMQCTVIALLGKDGGMIKNSADLPIIVPSQNTQHIQEAHLAAEHIICEWVEKSLFREVEA